MGGWLPLETVKVPVQSRFTEYVPVLSRQPGATLPLTATESSCVRFPSPSKVVLARPSTSNGGAPPGRKTVPWIVKAYVPLMVEFVQLARAVTADDAAKAMVNRTREIRNFMVPPKVCGVAFGLPQIRGLSCSVAM